MATERVNFEAQREFPRWPVPTTKPVRVDLGPAGSAVLMDISMGGTRVKSVAPLRRDSEIPLRIDIPERLEPLRCLARVVWSKPNGAAGLRFTNLPEDQKTALSSWIHELQDTAADKGHRDDEFTRITAQVRNMKLNNADALSLIARRATQIAGANTVVIALGKAEQLICLARAGDAPELGTPVPALGLTGECTRSRKPVHCLDASTDPRAGELKQGSALILPLLVNGELRGVMQVLAPRPGIFNAQRTESIEQLADAVVFVTHNALPRTRINSTGSLASVTPIRPAASTPAVAKPSDSGRMSAFSAPAVAKPSDSGRMAAFNPPAPTAEPAFVARETSIPIEPMAAPVQVAAPTPAMPTMDEPRFEQRMPVAPRAAVEDRRMERRVAPTVKAVYVPAPPPSSSRGKMLFAAAAVFVIFSVAFGIRLLRHEPAATVAAAAPVAEPPLVAHESVPSQPEPVRATVAPAEIPAAPVVKANAAKEPEPAQKAERVEKKAALVEKEPEPAPMVLASGAPVHRAQPVEPDSPAPSAPIAAAAMPGISLPTQTAAPKLIAPRVAKITGGTLIEHPSPVYPQLAVAQQLEGQVKLQVTITPTGTVENIRKISGPALLTGAAMSAVRRWRYDPPKIDGQAISREETITVDFKLPSRQH